MIIKLKERQFDTNKGEDYKQLLILIKKGIEISNNDLLSAIRSAIEDASLLTKADLELYASIPNLKQLKVIEVQKHKYFQAKNNEEGQYFTYLKADGENVFVALPTAKNQQEILYKLITTLVYESYRHAWNQRPCTTLRRVIAKIDPAHYNMDMQPDYFYNELESIEKQTKNYYGEYISDDSDSDEESQYSQEKFEKSKKILNRMSGESNKYKKKLKELMGKGNGDYEVVLFQRKPGSFSRAPEDKARVYIYYEPCVDATVFIKRKIDTFFVGTTYFFRLEKDKIVGVLVLPRKKTVEFEIKDELSKKVILELWEKPNLAPEETRKLIEIATKYTNHLITWRYVVAQPGKLPKGRGKQVSKKIDAWLKEKDIQNNVNNINLGSNWEVLFELLSKDTWLQKTLEAEIPVQPDVTSLARIYHEDLGEQVNKDLMLLNQSVGLRDQKPLEQIKTKFVVAQYRGIHYEKRQWNVFSRRRHRNLHEVEQPLYSKSVMVRSGFQDFCTLLLAIENKKEQTQEILQKNAELLEEQMLVLRSSGPIQYKNAYYLNVLDLLQELYTGDYKKFHALLKEIVEGRNAHIQFLENSVFNSYNPFLSTGDTGHHALKYAYGLKAYGGRNEEEKRKNERVLLKPRWRSSGRAERPYVGKVYVSLHPVQDYMSDNKPNHIPTLFNSGHIKMANVIVQEKETSFLGYLPKGRLITQHKAKYPSFKQKYKKIYAYKYGIDEAFFSSIREAFLRYSPHTSERKTLEALIGKYLCAYQEVRLVEEARLKAKERGEVLVYRDSTGRFQLMPSSAIPGSQNKGGWDVIEQNKKEIAEFVKKQLLEKKPGEHTGNIFKFFGTFTKSAEENSVEEVELGFSKK